MPTHQKPVSLDAIKALREQTSASLKDVRAALEAAQGDARKALEQLRQRGAAIAEQRQDRVIGQGRIETYVHHDGRLGAIVEVNCETDFVARTPDFVRFCRDVALHVAAMNPRGIHQEARGAATAGPAAASLLEQPFVKEPATTIQALLQGLIAKTGERIVIRRFARYVVGDATPLSAATTPAP